MTGARVPAGKRKLDFGRRKKDDVHQRAMIACGKALP
jgi:hypothetical protein